MTLHRARRTALAILAVALAAACSDPGAAEQEQQAACQTTVTGLDQAIERLGDAYEQLTADGYLAGETPPGAAAARAAADRQVANLVDLGCDPEFVRDALRGVSPAPGTDPIAAAVAAEVRRGLLGDPAPVALEREVGVEEDLARVVAAAPAGAVLRLSPGEHLTDEVIRVVRPVTILGSGTDDTTIVSSADQAAIVATDAAALRLSDVTVRHAAQSSVAVVQILVDGALLQRVRITGGATAADGGGGAGLVVTVDGMGPQPFAATDHARFSLTPWRTTLVDLEVVDNQGPGLVVAGTAAPRIVGAVLRGNGLCGVCYLGAASGSFSGAVVTENGLGLLLSGRAAPVVTDTQVRDNREDGILVEERASGRIEDSTVTGNPGRGVLVTDQAVTVLARMEVAGNGELGVAVAGAARASFSELVVVGHEYGIWLEGTSEADVTASEVRDSSEVAVVVRGQAGLRGEGIRCEHVEVGLLLLEEATTEHTGAGCELTDQR